MTLGSESVLTDNLSSHQEEKEDLPKLVRDEKDLSKLFCDEEDLPKLVCGEDDLPKLIHDEEDSKTQKNGVSQLKQQEKEAWSRVVEVGVSPNNDTMETNHKGPEEDHRSPEDGDTGSHKKPDHQTHLKDCTSKDSQEEPKFDPSFWEDENFHCFTVVLNKGAKDAFGFKLVRNQSTRRGVCHSNFSTVPKQCIDSVSITYKRLPSFFLSKFSQCLSMQQMMVHLSYP